jgi:hypothetical protein
VVVDVVPQEAVDVEVAVVNIVLPMMTDKTSLL